MWFYFLHPASTYLSQVREIVLMSCLCCVSSKCIGFGSVFASNSGSLASYCYRLEWLEWDQSLIYCDYDYLRVKFVLVFPDSVWVACLLLFWVLVSVTMTRTCVSIIEYASFFLLSLYSMTKLNIPHHSIAPTGLASLCNLVNRFLLKKTKIKAFLFFFELLVFLWLESGSIAISLPLS